MAETKAAFINKKTIFFDIAVFVVLCLYFIIGLKIYRDYGASVDEVEQIEAGHIMWQTYCGLFRKSEEKFADLQPIQQYHNRYYGQAATFPTVIIEALKNFSLDSSTIIRIRHLWNFLIWFSGIVCFSILIRKHFSNGSTVFFALLIHILTPRLFGDAFYNDRDTVLIALIWITLLCFEYCSKKENLFSIFLSGFFFALTINTRLFGLILLIPFAFFLCRAKRKQAWCLILLLTAVFWYLMMPALWGNLTAGIEEMFSLFAGGKQRTNETSGNAITLFFGKRYLETDLPFYYLPLWILISTPIISLLLAFVGMIRIAKQIRNKQFSDIIGISMLIIFIGGVTAICIIRPVLYSGWRHLFFFYVPIFWFITEALDFLPKRTVIFAVLTISLLFTVSELCRLHPYEYIYLNPIFRQYTGDFERDYWKLSSTECVQHIAEINSNEEIFIQNANATLQNIEIGLNPDIRNRLNIKGISSFRKKPAEYIIFNYNLEDGNNMQFPLYYPIYSVERNGIKLAEVFQREHANEITASSLAENYPPELDAIFDGDFETFWRSESTQSEPYEIEFELKDSIFLQGLSLLPGADEREYARNPIVEISMDGLQWYTPDFTVSGLLDIILPPVTCRFIRIRNAAQNDYCWSIREILLYTK